VTSPSAGHVRVARDLFLAASQTALTLTMLAYQTWLAADAITRTLARVYGTRRRLLEWVTAAQATAGLRLTCRVLSPDDRRARRAVLAAAVVAGARPERGRSRCRSCCSGPLARRRPLGEPAATAAPRRLAVIRRRACAAAGGPPHVAVLRDVRRRRGPCAAARHFQEDPMPVVARRTSPTNMGLYLLSTLAAREFAGWGRSTPSSA